MAEVGDLSAGGSGKNRSAKTIARALAASLAVVASLWIWQALTVRYNYGGNWTALFQMGDLTPAPDELKQGAYFWRNHTGYEGEEARIVAHDPLNAKGWVAYLDDPEARYAAWLMPAMAHALGLGRREWIDQGYFAAFLLFAGVGTFALTLEFGWAGIVFAVLPATLIGMDRMTVNVSLAALAAVALVASRKQAWGWFWPAVALAPLTMPQGWICPAAAFLVSVRWKNQRGICFASASLIPGLLLMQLTTGLGQRVLDSIIDGLAPWSAVASAKAWWEALTTAWPRGGPDLLIVVMHWLDKATLLTITAVAVWTIWRFKARTGRWERWAAALLVIPGALVHAERQLAEPFMWLDCFTPLLLMHWADTPRHWRVVRWAPLAICSLRTGYQFGFQVLGVLRGLAGGV